MCRTTSLLDCIWSNPPIRVGKAALHDHAASLARQAGARAATPTLVVHKHLGADSLQSWLTEADTRRSASHLRAATGSRVATPRMTVTTGK